MPTDVKIFNEETTTITYSKGPILWGWRDPANGLWKVPRNINEDTKSLKPNNDTTTNIKESNVAETASNLYELIKQIICYCHVAAGFLTKATWLKAIKAGFLPVGQCQWHQQSWSTLQHSMKHKKDLWQQKRSVSSTKKSVNNSDTNAGSFPKK